MTNNTITSNTVITYDDIRKNADFQCYIQKGNDLLGVLGYTDHSAAHTSKVAEQAADILVQLGYEGRVVELAKIAGLIHDIGNMINRKEHAQTGAIMAFTMLTNLGMPAEEIAAVVSAVGNHDEDGGIPVNPASAAIIIADKSDVRRSRVRNTDFATFDIHDRVNYAAVESSLLVTEDKAIELRLTIDDKICSVVDFFEIFLTRMLMCRRAANFLGADFRLVTNGARLL